MKKNRKLFFSVSNSGGTIYKIREFKKLGFTIIAGDANPNAIGKFYADKFYELPWQSEENYMDVIFDIIKKEKVDIYVPAGEAESLRVAKMRKKFLDLGCTPTAANVKTIETAIDKAVLFDFLSKETDIPMMKYHVVNNLQDFEEGLEKLKGLKLCMKPATASGSRGFIILDENILTANELFKTRITALRVTPDYVRAVLKSSSSVPKTVMMEFVDGENVNANMVCKNGEVVWHSINTRGNVKAGLSTDGTVIDNPELETHNRKIARALNTTGMITTQFIGDKIIEINPRWSTSLFHGTINEYLMGIKVWTGEEIFVDPEDKKSYPGLKYHRYFETQIYR